MTNYTTRKEAARNEAINWQYEFDQHNYSYQELADFYEHFEQLGRRYGLLEEFRENGIL